MTNYYLEGSDDNTCAYTRKKNVLKRIPGRYSSEIKTKMEEDRAKWRKKIKIKTYAPEELSKTI